MAQGRKKVPPKRTTGLSGALYAPQFSDILEIGAHCEAGLSSVKGVYDVSGRQGLFFASNGNNRIFRKMWRKFSSGFSKFSPKGSGKNF